MLIKQVNETQCVELTIERKGGCRACANDTTNRMNVRFAAEQGEVAVQNEPVFDFCLKRHCGMKVSYGVICRTSVGKDYVFLSSDGYILSLMNRYLAGQFEGD